MLQTVHQQRLSLIAKCKDLEQQTDALLARFTSTEADRVATEARVAALELQLAEAVRAREALATEQSSLRTQLTEQAATLAAWRCLEKRLRRTEADLQGLQRACVVFTPEERTLRSADCGDHSRRGRLLRVVDPYTVHDTTTDLGYIVDAVQPSPSTATSSPNKPSLNVLDEVVLAVAYEAAEGISSTLVLGGPSSSSSSAADAIQDEMLLGGRHHTFASSPRAVPSTDGLLVSTVRQVLRCVQKESVQYRVRLSVAQLSPPSLCDAAAVDLLAGLATTSHAVAPRDAESFVSLTAVPRLAGPARADPQNGLLTSAAVVSALPIASEDDVTRLVSHARRRRDGVLRAQLEEITLVHRASRAAPDTPVNSSSVADLAGGLVVVLTVESVDGRGQFRRAAIRFVQLPRATPASPRSGVWHHWSEATVRALMDAVHVAAAAPAAASCSSSSAEPHEGRFRGLGTLGEFLHELFSGHSKAVLLCCCPCEGLARAPLPDVPGAALEVHCTSTAVSEWLQLAHDFCHAVHHAPSAQEPFCIPEEVLELQGHLAGSRPAM